MSKIFAIANKKGGVGKTTTTMSLGAALARMGKQVLLVDLDPQGDLSRYLGNDIDGANINTLLLATAGNAPVDVSSCLRHSDGEQLDYVPSSVALADCEMQLTTVIGREMVLRRVLQHETFSKYDYVLIDCPPALGILTINAFVAANKVIVPVELEMFSYEGMTSLLDVLGIVRQTINPTLELGGILKTKYDHSNMTTAVSDALERDYNETVFKTYISRAKEAANSSYRRCSLVSYKNKLGDQYMQLAAELLAREGDV